MRRGGRASSRASQCRRAAEEDAAVIETDTGYLLGLLSRNAWLRIPLKPGNPAGRWRFHRRCRLFRGGGSGPGGLACRRARLQALRRRGGCGRSAPSPRPRLSQSLCRPMVKRCTGPRSARRCPGCGPGADIGLRGPIRPDLPNQLQVRIRLLAGLRSCEQTGEEGLRPPLFSTMHAVADHPSAMAGPTAELPRHDSHSAAVGLEAHPISCPALAGVEA